MSLSVPKFLLDENVRIELFDFLKKHSFDAIQVRGISNGRAAEISRAQKRVLVTNDSDFADRVLYPQTKIFSVVLLRVPQARADILIKSFSLLLKLRTEEFEGKIFELNVNGVKIIG